MPTAAYSVRIPDDMIDETDRKRERLGLNFSDYARIAIAEKNGRDEPAEVRHLVTRAETAEARAERAETELVLVKARLANLAGVQGPDTPAEDSVSHLDRLADLIQNSAPENPVTPGGLAVRTGYHRNSVGRHLAALLEAGLVTKEKKGTREAFYHAVPGADIHAALQEIVNGNRVPAPKKAPRKPPAARTKPQKPAPADAAIPAAAGPDVAVEVEQIRGEMKQMQDLMLRMATGKYETPVQDRVAQVRQLAQNAGMDLKPASELVTAGTQAAPFATPFKAPPIPLVAEDDDEDLRKCTHHVPAGTRCKICPR